MSTIDIQPPSNVYATFGRLNYTPWHAIAEFVDNSTQSYFAAERELRDAGVRHLRVNITHSNKSLVVRDNALGMDAAVLERALRLNSPPPDTSGRSEFGMGLKTAACWFGKFWTLSTTRLGDPWRYTVKFDVDDIANSGSTTLDVVRTVVSPDIHGTELTIERLGRTMSGTQVAKTKRFLASIYRLDLRRGDVSLTWNKQELEYEEAELFPWEDGKGGTARVAVDCHVTDPATGRRHHVTGWAGAMLRMSAGQAGFALLRRGRMIIGGPDMGWRPLSVVGSLNSHSGKRLVGELQMDSFPVSFTKDGFAWDGGLEEELESAISSQIEGIRSFAENARVATARLEPHDFIRAVDEVQAGVDSPIYLGAISGAREPSNHEILPQAVGDVSATMARVVPQDLLVTIGNKMLRLRLVQVEGGPHQSWLSVQADQLDPNLFHVHLNIGNRFVAPHMSHEGERTLVAKFALALAVAEEQARYAFAGDSAAAEELREFISLCLDNSVSG